MRLRASTTLIVAATIALTGCSSSGAGGTATAASSAPATLLDTLLPPSGTYDAAVRDRGEISCVRASVAASLTVLQDLASQGLPLGYQDATTAILYVQRSLESGDLVPDSTPSGDRSTAYLQAAGAGLAELAQTKSNTAASALLQGPLDVLVSEADRLCMGYGGYPSAVGPPPA
jgi:hypothetical protein